MGPTGNYCRRESNTPKREASPGSRRPSSVVLALGGKLSKASEDIVRWCYGLTTIRRSFVLKDEIIFVDHDGGARKVVMCPDSDRSPVGRQARASSAMAAAFLRADSIRAISASRASAQALSPRLRPAEARDGWRIGCACPRDLLRRGRSPLVALWKATSAKSHFALRPPRSHAAPGRGSATAAMSACPSGTWARGEHVSR